MTTEQRVRETHECKFCEGTGKLSLPCPARHHNHMITVNCGRCAGLGLASLEPLDVYDSTEEDTLP